MTSSVINKFVAVLELEQPGVLYVCYGGALAVTCSTSADILRWNITVPLLQNQNQRMFERRLSRIGTVRMVAPIVTAIATINVSRSLNNDSYLPLISTISTDNITADLNGTMLICSGLSRQGELLANESVGIILVGNKNGNIINTFIHFMNDTINTPNVNASKRFGTNSITVTLEWTHIHGESYSVSVDPVVNVNYMERNSQAKLVVMYDTKYNISVVASLCGANRTTFIIVNQGKLIRLIMTV